jgi:hypothetical protein
MNPDAAGDHAFEPLSYREMAMREDLRMYLQSGPTMESLRLLQNDVATRPGSNGARMAPTRQ